MKREEERREERREEICGENCGPHLALNLFFLSSSPFSSPFLPFSSLSMRFVNSRPLCDNFIVRRPFLRLNRQILPFRYIQKRKRETEKLAHWCSDHSHTCDPPIFLLSSGQNIQKLIKKSLIFLYFNEIFVILTKIY